MTTENIKQFVINEPIMIQAKQAQSNFKPSIFSSNTVASTAIQRPLSQITDKKNMKNEIFVDIFEKLSVRLNSLTYFSGIVQFKWVCNQ